MTKLALMQPSRVRHWEPGFLQRVKAELSLAQSTTQSGSSFQVVDDVNEADTILYLDSNYDKNVSDIAGYRKLLRWAVERHKTIFSLSFEDRPLTALPGIYTSATPQSFDPSLHLSWPHLEPPNDQVENAAVVDTALTQAEQTKYMFSFAGSCSHPLRRKLFAFGKAINQPGVCNVYEVDRWFDHTEQEQQQYVDDILDCRFVLCPRGLAAYSHRIIESILLNRVPVIIADDWVPFSFTADKYYVQIPEEDLNNIHDILQQELKNYDMYCANLVKLKATWLAKGRRYQILVEQFLKFRSRNPSEHHPKVLLERLASETFLEGNGLLAHQQLLQTVAHLPGRGKQILRKIITSFSSP